MNKSIVINQEGNITFIECKDNVEAYEVYEAIKERHKDLPFDANVTVIFSDGSISHSRINCYAKPDVYLSSTILA